MTGLWSVSGAGNLGHEAQGMGHWEWGVWYVWHVSCGWQGQQIDSIRLR